MASRSRWIALLGLCGAACCTPRGGTTPPGSASEAPVSPAAAPGRAPGPADHEIVAIDAFGGQACGLARSGALYCWGSVAVPGERARRSVPRLLRMPGVPPLAGFVLVYGGLVGWDEHGDTIAISDDIPPDFRVHEGVFLSAMVSPGAWSSELRRVRARAASQRCLLTTDGRLLCNGPANPGTQYRDRFPGRYVALGTGRFACAVDEAGRPVAINASEHELSAEDSFGKAMAPFEVRPIEGLPLGPTSLACSYGKLDGGKDLRPLACAVDDHRRLTCTDPALVAALERAAEGVPILSVVADEHFCVRRDDGQARCVKTEYLPDAALLPSLAGYDASWGLAVGHEAICTLAFDGIVRCWGERGVPQLGDGSVLELPAPVHVEGFDGTVEVSHAGGITCARDSEGSVRCFGRFGSTVIEPRPLQLPEPIDLMVGGDPLCVRGRESQAYYCRDPLQSFFGGSLPDHFTPVVDTKGRKLGRKVASVAVDLGVGVRVALQDGRSGMFHYSGRRKPLRIDMGRGRPEKMRHVVPGGGIRADGRGEFELDGRVFVTRGPVQAIVRVASRPCFLDDAQQLSCFDQALGRAEVIATDVVAVDPLGGALGANGDALALELLEGEPVARKREGLPAMAQLAGPCGRSVDGQVWCWGTLEQLPGPPHRLEPLPVEFEP